MPVSMSIAERIARVRERLDAAARRSGRSPDSISLMAVSKTVPPEVIRQAYDCGICLFGENRVQEFAGKAKTLRELAGFQCHLIGHLQSNKSQAAAELFDGVDSLDSMRLAEKLSSAAQKLGKTLPALIEINIGGENAKSGVAPDSAELEQLLQAASVLSVDIRGLMTVPPYSEDPESTRPYFRKMKDLFGEITRRTLPSIKMNVLSMGMSHDFEVAVEEGATCVRVGTAIFGERPGGGVR
jgi:PLP dependent protein